MDLIIESELVVKLFNRKNEPTKYPLILVQCKLKNNMKCSILLKNNQEYEAVEIEELYNKCWKIEVFFKFLKWHLNFSYVLLCSYNDLKVDDV